MTQSLTRSVLVFVALLAASQSTIAQTEVLFSVSRYFNEQGNTSYALEPIVVLDRGLHAWSAKPWLALSEPPVFGDDEPYQHFAKKYLAQGKSYQLIFGGGKSGSLTIKQELENEVRLQTDIKVGGYVYALASDAKTLGQAETVRRAPTDSEKSVGLKLAREAYRKQGIAETALEQIKILNLTAVDIDGDQSVELIGSFSIQSVTTSFGSAQIIEHPLFMIMEPKGEEWSAAFVSLPQYQQRYFDYRLPKQYLVDYLDLDGDDIAEIITKVDHDHLWHYKIYRRLEEGWAVIYSGGGGGGC